MADVVQTTLQLRRRWTNAKPTLVHCIVFTGMKNRNSLNIKYWHNIAPSLRHLSNIRPALNQRPCFLGRRGWLTGFCMCQLLRLSSQKAVAAYLKSKQLLPFGFARQLLFPSMMSLPSSAILSTTTPSWYQGSSVKVTLSSIPANARWPNTGLMLARRRRRWANISPALGQRVCLLGYCCAKLKGCISGYTRTW